MLVQGRLDLSSNAYARDAVTQALARSRFVIAVCNRTGDNVTYNTSIEDGGFCPLDLSRWLFAFNAITIFNFGKTAVLDPRLPWIVSRPLRRYVFPGEKHVQLIVGQCRAG